MPCDTLEAHTHCNFQLWTIQTSVLCVNVTGAFSNFELFYAFIDFVYVIKQTVSSAHTLILTSFACRWVCLPKSWISNEKPIEQKNHMEMHSMGCENFLWKLHAKFPCWVWQSKPPKITTGSFQDSIQLCNENIIVAITNGFCGQSCRTLIYFRLQSKKLLFQLFNNEI